MNFRISVGAAGDERRPPNQRLITKKQYISFIRNTDMSELIRERLIDLGNKVPSASLTYIVKNIHTYIGRAASQINAEKNKEIEERRLYESQNQFVEDIVECEVSEEKVPEEETNPVVVGIDGMDAIDIETSCDAQREAESGLFDVPPAEGCEFCAVADGEHTDGPSEATDAPADTPSVSDDRLRADDGATKGVSGKNKRSRRSRS